MRSVSVVILRGIKLRMMIFRGRISCDDADSESFTKMFSFFNASTAGKFDGMFNGIFSSSFPFFPAKIHIIWLLWYVYDRNQMHVGLI